MKLKKNIAISESGYVFNPSNGESYTLNPVGLEILNMLKDNTGYEEIKSTILAKYDTDDTSFERYFYDFTAMLQQYNLLEEDILYRNAY